eukprot:1769994-Heterocapsa_arctica.AAC.1
MLPDLPNSQVDRRLARCQAVLLRRVLLLEGGPNGDVVGTGRNSGQPRRSLRNFSAAGLGRRARRRGGSRPSSWARDLRPGQRGPQPISLYADVRGREARVLVSAIRRPQLPQLGPGVAAMVEGER